MGKHNLKVGDSVTVDGAYCVIVGRKAGRVKVWCPRLNVHGSISICKAVPVSLDHEPCGMSFVELIKSLKCS